jgi:hypothetical protein
MGKIVTIGQSNFDLPNQGTQPSDKGSKRSWGENLSDIIDALITVVNTLQGPDDVPETAEVILNTSGTKQLVSFHFNSTSVRSFEASYNISRTITKEIFSFTGDGINPTVIITGGASAYNHDLKNGQLITISGTGIIGLDANHYITKFPGDDTKFTIPLLYNGTETLGQFRIELIESGDLLGNYSQDGWQLAQTKIDDAKIVLDLDATGTVTYSVEVLDGISPEGLIKFIAKSLLSN